MPKHAKIEDTIEQAIGDTLKKELTAEERIKCLAVAVRWVAVKNKIVTGEQGAGFEESDGG